jgi:FAD synthetase
VPRTDGQTASAPTTSRHSDLSKSLQAIYIVSRDPFPEVEDFVARTAKQYHLDLVRCALPMRQALDAYLSDNPAVEAVFMGTRRTDPHSDTLGHFSPTDPDWPQFMRINPVIDWHYADIWAVSNSTRCGTI